jgi:CHAT domain-containing protein
LVILSACNTAGAQSENAEALSGMARAFFYAGARMLLVSHWEVGSDAAVKLTTRAFAELRSSRPIGRAEAMRVSMRKLTENGRCRTTSTVAPSTWDRGDPPIQKRTCWTSMGRNNNPPEVMTAL